MYFPLCLIFHVFVEFHTEQSQKIRLFVGKSAVDEDKIGPVLVQNR